MDIQGHAARTEANIDVVRKAPEVHPLMNLRHMPNTLLHLSKNKDLTHCPYRVERP